LIERITVIRHRELSINGFVARSAVKGPSLVKSKEIIIFIQAQVAVPTA
jgi:hypothetical protein